MNATEDDPRIPRVPSRKKAIADAEWVVSISLHRPDGKKSGKQITLTDSWVARNPNECGRLLASAMLELAIK